LIYQINDTHLHVVETTEPTYATRQFYLGLLQ